MLFSHKKKTKKRTMDVWNLSLIFSEQKVYDAKLLHIKFDAEFWRARAAFQWLAFGRPTAGNDVVATIFIRLFLFFFFPFFPFFSPSRPFLIEGVLGSKNLFSES